MSDFLENVIHDVVTYIEHAHQKTVTTMDVVYALKRQGRTFYGFGFEVRIGSDFCSLCKSLASKKKKKNEKGTAVEDWSSRKVGKPIKKI